MGGERTRVSSMSNVVLTRRPRGVHTLYLVDVEVHLRSRLELSVQSRDAAGPNQVLHLVFEDEQLDSELLLRHVQEACEFGYRHGGVELQEAAATQ